MKIRLLLLSLGLLMAVVGGVRAQDDFFFDEEPEPVAVVSPDPATTSYPPPFKVIRRELRCSLVSEEAEIHVFENHIFFRGDFVYEGVRDINSLAAYGMFDDEGYLCVPVYVPRSWNDPQQITDFTMMKVTLDRQRVPVKLKNLGLRFPESDRLNTECPPGLKVIWFEAELTDLDLGKRTFFWKQRPVSILYRQLHFRDGGAIKSIYTPILPRVNRGIYRIDLIPGPDIKADLISSHQTFEENDRGGVTLFPESFEKILLKVVSRPRPAPPAAAE